MCKTIKLNPTRENMKEQSCFHEKLCHICTYSSNNQSSKIKSRELIQKNSYVHDCDQSGVFLQRQKRIFISFVKKFTKESQ